MVRQSHHTTEQNQNFPVDLPCAPVIYINGEEIKNVTAENGYFDIDRTWENDTVNIYFPATLTMSSLPDMPQLTAFAEGPVVLAGLYEKDCGIYMKDGNPESALAYTTEHTLKLSDLSALTFSFTYQRDILLSSCSSKEAPSL